MKNIIPILILLVNGVIAQVPILNSNPAYNNKVIYLDFDGQVVKGTAWNGGNTINAAASTITNANKIAVWKRVSEDYRPFDVNVTTDSVRFNNANPTKRIRVVITPTSSWYPSAGGVAYLGSFTWGGTPGTPCWVFENALGYSAKSIAEAAAHEVGHTLTLRHQSVYDAACNKTAEYNPGTGSGVTSWAPIMGVGYSDNVTIWHIGKSASSCNTIQYDHSNSGIGITSPGYLNFLPDDAGDTYSMAKFLNLGSLNLLDSGIITQPTDIDAYRFTICDNRYVSFSVKPNALDTTSYTGANLDVRFQLYNNSGTLLLTDTSLTRLHTLAGINLTPGSYYFTIDGGRSNNYTDYGSLGKYYIRIKATNPPAISNAIITPSSVCSGINNVLSYTSSGTPNSFIWTINGPATATYSVANPTIIFTPPGIYTITLLASSPSATGCPVMSLLNVQAAPNLFVTGNTNAICAGKSATLNLSGANSFTWLPTNFITNSQVVTPQVTTNYTVTGSAGSCINSMVVTVSVTPPFTVSAVPSKTVACGGDTISVMGTGASSYTFFPGGGSQNPLLLTPVNNTTIFVSGSIGDCMQTGTTMILAEPDFSVQVSISKEEACEGDTISIYASGASSYTFNPGLVTTNPATMIVNATTVYTVTGANNPQCPKDQITGVTMVSCNYAGLKEEEAGGPLIFPNPAAGSFVIRSASNDQVSVTGTDGKLMYSSAGGDLVVQTNHWPAGIYFVIIKNAGKTACKKIIVE